ncbi:MAG: hypothetical protein ACE5GY_09565 [Thermodesulfobacteriota bacterium]
MDPFIVFVVFTALTPVSNHLALKASRTYNPEYEEINISLNMKESKERAKYMAKLLDKFEGKKGQETALKSNLLDDKFRENGQDGPAL